MKNQLIILTLNRQTKSSLSPGLVGGWTIESTLFAILGLVGLLSIALAAAPIL